MSRIGLVDKQAFYTFLGAVVGFILSMVPWPDMYRYFNGVGMWDRGVYIEKIVSGDVRFNFFDYDGFISLITNEYVWGWLENLVYHSDVLDVEDFLAVISALSLASFSSALSKKGFFLLIPFLLNPLVIDLAYSQVRLSLAVSLIYWMYVFGVERLLYVVVVGIFVSMIHTAGLIFFSVYLLSLVSVKFRALGASSFEWRLFVLVGFGLFWGVIVGPLREFILSYIGDRRVVYSDMASSYLYNSFWLFLFFVFLANFRKIASFVEGRFSISILSAFVVLAVSGGYSLRFISASFPFILISLFSVSKKCRWISVSCFVLYSLAQWYYYFFV